MPGLGQADGPGLFGSASGRGFRSGFLAVGARRLDRAEIAQRIQRPVDLSLTLRRYLDRRHLLAAELRQEGSRGCSAFWGKGDDEAQYQRRGQAAGGDAPRRGYSRNRHRDGLQRTSWRLSRRGRPPASLESLTGDRDFGG